jgi:hypothetical protein
MIHFGANLKKGLQRYKTQGEVTNWQPVALKEGCRTSLCETELGFGPK